ncbi:Peptidyl-prolyl cis-trans isomerase ppiD [Thioalkalivibrio nitratireducens DSM 14787]|uniref:Periplasmic chaperone PpiD n=1 Tax=Thioalkalivibrio nitratireducens (strain DSM 14787 / UNIQEM 213 / ALEN2) TaxID=1255043 RepID=L0DXS8_THIND|nr:SurA N-terminal domain-containing protein [Thioalkalivibrio nitratireducens]AGA34369.1 Peptidyl-prolyl cis-trans isomerase ppiD [Thioalkalivibrio nitratireducens DSM 14787]
MLQSIRDKATGWLAYVIIGLIAIPFALWGLGEYFGGAGPLVAAEVNKTEIPVRLVHQEARAQRDQIARMFGGDVPADLFDERAIRNAALEALIQRELLRQAAEEAGFRASATGVVREIQAIPQFRDNGRFSPERYQAVLQAQRMSPGEFERDVAHQIVLAQVQQAVEASGDLPMSTVREFAQLRNQVRVASWRILEADAFDRPEVVDDAAIESYYRENPERFTTEEQLQVAYLRLDPVALEAGIAVTEQEIRDHYEVNAQRYAEPELRRVRQVLIERDTEDAEARIRELRERLDQGEDFSDLAREHSQDRLSADRGGDIGQVARGDLDSVLETVIFSLPAGLVSQPVQTRLGWHVVEVTEIQPSRPRPFGEVRDEVERDLRDRRAEQRQIRVLDDLLAQSFEYPDSLGPASRATGLEMRTTDWFTRGEGGGVARFPGVREAAFSTAVRVDGRNSEAVDLPDGSTLVLRLQERQEPRVLSLDEVAGEIRELLRRDAAAQAARETGESILATLEAGDATVASLAEEAPGAWVRSIPVNRTTGPEVEDVEMPPSLARHLFQMAAPVEDSARHEGVRLPDGDFAVLVLESVETLELDAVAEELARVADDLQIAYAGAEFRAYLDWLESEAKVRRYLENLE